MKLSTGLKWVKGALYAKASYYQEHKFHCRLLNFYIPIATGKYLFSISCKDAGTAFVR